jgi:hypothetical protein
LTSKVSEYILICKYLQHIFGGKMATLVELIRDGYFPKELPPSFYTGSFASRVCAPNVVLPHGFQNGLPNKKTTLACKYNFCQSGKLYRCLTLLNPIAFYNLASEIHADWHLLFPLASASPISVTNPSSGPLNGRAIASVNPWSSLPLTRANRHTGSRYLLKADVNRYYHSIYTHSIPWAIHTKSVAKSTRGPGLFGNRIDALFQKCQDGQTMGIPVGTDISFLIAEIILTAVDLKLQTKIPKLNGFRWVDDYELSFDTLSEAEFARQELQSVLSEYELALNQEKTDILPLPFKIVEDWSYELRNYLISPTAKKQRSDLIGYFNHAIELSKLYPGKAVLKYAISRLKGFQVHSSNEDLFQTLLLYCVSYEQGTLSYVINILNRLKTNGNTISSSKVEKTLNSHILYHAPLDSTSEVAWAIWGALKLGIRLNLQTSQAISNMDNSVIALLALDAESKGLVTNPLNKGLWVKCMTTAGLYQENWLLSYEANVKGWMRSPRNVDYVLSDANFGFLKQNGVEFYNSQTTIIQPPAIQPPILPLPPVQPIIVMPPTEVPEPDEVSPI